MLLRDFFIDTLLQDRALFCYTNKPHGGLFSRHYYSKYRISWNTTEVMGKSQALAPVTGRTSTPSLGT